MLWDFTLLHKKGREQFKIMLSFNAIEVPRGAPGNDFLQCWPIIWLSMFLIGYLGPWGLMGAVKNSRIFGGILGVYWGYSGTILELLWLRQASWGLSVLYCGYPCYLEAIWGLSVLFGGH